MTPITPSLRHPRRVLAAALTLGLGAELLFDGPLLGASFPLFVGAFLAALAVVAGREGLHGGRRVAVLAVPMLIIASFVALRASPELTALNVITCAVLAGLVVQGFSGSLDLANLKLWEIAARPVEGWAKSLWSAATPLKESVDTERAGAFAKTHGRTVLRAVLLTVPIAGVFIGLLAAGDDRFAEAIGQLGDLLLPGDDSGSHLVWVSGGTLLAAGLLAHALRRRVWPAGQPAPSGEPEPSFGMIGPAEGLSVVASLVVIFAGFGAVQAKGFFVERAKLIPSTPGVGWGNYTREGFVQLMVAAGLTLGLLVVLPAITRLETPRTKRAFQLGSSALIALTLLILATGANRLVAYEEQYGFSVTRVFGHVFAFALAGVLVWRGLTLWVWPHRFAIGALAGALGWLITLNAIDPERFVVERNLARFDASGHLDLKYLLTLSSDAVPPLLEGLAERAPGSDWLSQHVHWATFDASLASVCRWHEQDDDEGRWQATNLSRAKARPARARCDGGALTPPAAARAQPAPRPGG